MVRYEMKQQTRWSTKSKATKTMNEWKKHINFILNLKTILPSKTKRFKMGSIRKGTLSNFKIK